MKQVIMAAVILCTVVGLSSYRNTADTDNTLTPSEKKTGWKLLFDGQSNAGWRAYQNKPINSWLVADGVLHCKAGSAEQGIQRADLVTEREYENFDLSVDWKISPQGNSGILYMVTEEFRDASLSGPEYQLIDDVNFPEKLQDWQKTGANYAMDPAPAAAPKPAGEWNTSRIVVNKGHVQHWLNGKKLLDFEMWTGEWNKKKMSGKWKDAPGYGKAKKGHIALQNHGSEAWFKNIKIKQL